jgi:hypothetical protein
MIDVLLRTKIKTFRYYIQNFVDDEDYYRPTINAGILLVKYAQNTYYFKKHKN